MLSASFFCARRQWSLLILIYFRSDPIFNGNKRALKWLLRAGDGGTKKAAATPSLLLLIAIYCFWLHLSIFYLRNITSLLLSGIDIHVECHPASREGARDAILEETHSSTAFQYIIEETPGRLKLHSRDTQQHRLFVLPIGPFYHSTRPPPLWSHSCIIIEPSYDGT